MSAERKIWIVLQKVEESLAIYETCADSTGKDIILNSLTQAIEALEDKVVLPPAEEGS